LTAENRNGKLNSMLLKTLAAKKRKIINLKVTEAEHTKAFAQAKKYTKGNLSAWIRFSATHFEPKRTDLTKRAG